MRKIILFFILYIPMIFMAENISRSNKLCFTENKGQVSDQYYNPRPDILFGGTDGRLSFYLKNNGISYQLYRTDSWKDDDSGSELPGNEVSRRVIDKRTIYRLDVEWMGVNTQAVITTGEALPGYNNYYLASCPNGAMEVRSYKDVTYQNIYSGINLIWYQKNGKLKYDYTIAAGADYRQIRLNFKGAEKLSINKTGELVIETPLGKIIEQAPNVTQNGKQLKADWKINKSVVSFNILNADPALPLLIDPGVRQWGTYYGGGADDLVWATTKDPSSSNIYTSGYTSSVGGTIIATAGSHQSAHSGNGLENAFLVKWTPLGVRIWGTYYGGNGRDIGLGCAVDPFGNAFLAGYTVSNNLGAIATPGSLQTTLGGNWDAFLVKFNSAGVRQWGTYCGGSGIDFGNSCAADASGNVYFCGKVNATAGTVVATPGSHQPAYFANEDAFLIKFDPNGSRIWGTYYGGEGADAANYCETDASGYIYLTGNTSSTVNIATPGAHQITYGGGSYDGFLVKFNSSGVRQWGTYYGGSGDDRSNGFCRDITTGNMYIAGCTGSSNGNSIATDGSHQNTNGGGLFDSFVVQFNASGSRQWGTYYGGSADDRANGCAINILGYVYIAGYTGTSTGSIIATPGSHQPVFGGGTFDAYVAQFNNAGTRLWGTYYGGPGFDLGEGCTTDNNSNVYLVGLTDNIPGTVIATNGSHQSSYGGSTSDGFFVQFYDCSAPPSPISITSPANQNICTGNSVTLSVTGFGTINWYNVPNNGVSLGTGTAYISPVLSAGIYTFYAGANTCTPSLVRTGVTVTVHALPNVIATSSNSLTLCAGQSATLYASGANSYTWSMGGNNNFTVISPVVTTNYTISGTDIYGCTNSSTITQIVSTCVGIEQLANDAVSVSAHPNPTNSKVMLTGVPASADIAVLNAFGQLVFNESSGKIVTGPLGVEVSLLNCPPGIYFIKIDHEGKLQTLKVLRQ